MQVTLCWLCPLFKIKVEIGIPGMQTSKQSNKKILLVCNQTHLDILDFACSCMSMAGVMYTRYCKFCAFLILYCPWQVPTHEADFVDDASPWYIPIQTLLDSCATAFTSR